MIRIQHLFCAIAMLSGMASAWGNQGLADCGGLFLLDQTNQTFSATHCAVSDSVTHHNLQFWGAYRYTQWDATWLQDGWLLEGTQKNHSGNAGLRGDWKYLSLATDFSKGASGEWISAMSTLKLPDSIFYANASMGKGTLHLFTLTWNPENSSGLIDTISGDWETEAIKKSFSLGMVFHHHQLQANFSTLKTHRAPLGSTHYSLRDSSLLYGMELKYDYHFNTGFASLQMRHLDLESHIFGLRNEDGNTKRFFYLPLDLEYNEIWGTLVYTNWELRMGYGKAAIKIPQETRRFYETLSPNRVLDYSITQVLSFSFYQRNYRIAGDIDGYWLATSLGYSWEKEIHRWHWKPALRSDFFRVQGTMNITKTNESTNLFGGSSYKEYYEGRLTFVGANAKIASRFESPHRQFFVDVSLGQIIPFYFHSVFEEIDAEASTGNGDSEASSNTNYTPFRDGFSAGLQLGIHF